MPEERGREDQARAQRIRQGSGGGRQERAPATWWWRAGLRRGGGGAQGGNRWRRAVACGAAANSGTGGEATRAVREASIGGWAAACVTRGGDAGGGRPGLRGPAMGSGGPRWPLAGGGGAGHVTGSDWCAVSAQTRPVRAAGGGGRLGFRPKMEGEVPLYR
nr:glycine-rich cell wall structural protein 1.8-like [Aegilops tauschii subsp. strangulata]